VGLVKTGVSALGKLLVVIVLAATFMAGMVGVVWLSLRGEEIKVPEIVGKDFLESERELTALGLKIKRRSYRYSEEKPNTVIEQAPRAGDTVKTGQTVLVVVAQANPEGTEAPAPVKKADEEEPSADNSAEKPKKSNSNTAKKPEKTRDVISNKANKNANAANANTSSANSNKSGSNSNDSNNKSTTPAPTPKQTPKPVKTPNTPNDRPAATGGDTRNRRVPQ
jgi:hypothetical protein